jgi:threonine dehydrogenase-like Zn-dependent dehydrogenase
MKAALLEDVKKMTVQTVPDPEVGEREVLIRVGAVGVCGTDLHLFQGDGNYNFDAQGRPIPLTVQPQILGHEFAGEVIEVGRGVKDLKPGDRVLCDQGRNCWSEGREQLCSYCASGDSHQCQYYREHGIMGLPGAMAEYLSITAVNCIRLGDETSFEQGALAEPVACITHSSDRVDRSASRYTFGGLEEHSKGGERIRNVLIFGAGPAGLLFLQYLRNVKRFDGLIFVADVREQNLKFVAQFGGTPVNVAKNDLEKTVQDLTKGERIHYLIEACGNGAVYKLIPGLLRKQGTLLIYGAGHRAGNDLNLLDPIAFVEPTLVFSIGASGGFDPDGRPTIYRRSLELVSSGQVHVLPFVTHRYRVLDQIHKAFEEDFMRQDYIKGVLNLQ